MKVFISWSGERSKIVADSLKKWLSDVFQHIEVWMSAHDIDAGAKWNNELDSVLENTNLGIICLTPENQHAPWMLYEAGALAKTSKISRVIPYRIGLAAADVQYPLAQFQGVDADKEGTHKLLHSINEASGMAIAIDKVDRIFEKWWTDLDKELKRLPEAKTRLFTKRADREILEEILELIRNQARSYTAASESHIPEVIWPVRGMKKANSTIKIDTRPLLGDNASIVRLKYDPNESISIFLDSIYYYLNRKANIPAYTYGEIWLLQDTETGEKFDTIGIEYCRTRGEEPDVRTVASVGIHNGQTLKVIPAR